jgi:hypothetical protein
MKSDKIYVEKPSPKDDKKKEQKEALINKDTVTIKENQEPTKMGTVNDTPWGKDAKNSKKKGTGSEITDGEDG